jgi:UDP-glucose 4-epimerase
MVTCGEQSLRRSTILITLQRIPYMMLKDQSILVTGGAGFIGSHLVERLLLENEVTVLDNFSSGKREFLAHHQDNPDFHFQELDLRDACLLEKAMDGMDMVFHLAANPDVKLGAENTCVHLEQNVQVTHNLLEAMRKSGVRRLAFTSTSTVYGEAATVPTPEDYGPLLPISLYGASKLSCEALISSFCHTFDMQSWIYRFANIVGERGTHGVLVDFIRKLQENPERLEILGSGKQRKSYLEVKDCVQAMLDAVENSCEETNVFNIGSADTVDVTEIAEIVVEQMGLSGVKYDYTGGIDGRGWKGDVKVMQLSIEKIKKHGWEPRLGSAGAIRTAVASLLRDAL